VNSNNVRTLVKAALAAPSADNTQPFGYQWDGQNLEMYYDADRVAGKTFGPRDAATLLSAGAAMENIDQAAKPWNIPSNWDLSPLHRSTGQTLAILDLSTQSEQIDINDQPPLFNRHTNRLPFLKTPIPGAILQALQSQTEGNAKVKVISDRSAVKSIAKLVQSASEIRFQTRDVHEWLGQSLRFTAQEVNAGDGLDVATLHLPPGGKSFLKLISSWKWMNRLNKIGAYKALSAIDSQPIADAPAILAISSGLTPEDTISAGRLMERVWIDLNSQDISVHPYYVIPDQLQRLTQKKVPSTLIKQAEDLRNDAQQALDLSSNSTVYMMFRIGHTKHNAIRSKRIDFDRCFTTTSNS